MSSFALTLTDSLLIIHKKKHETFMSWSLTAQIQME